MYHLGGPHKDSTNKLIVYLQTVPPTVPLFARITVEPQNFDPPPPPGNEGVPKSEMSVTLISSTSLKILCSHEEYAAMISIELILKLKLCNIEQNLTTLTLFIEVLMILTK